MRFMGGGGDEPGIGVLASAFCPAVFGVGLSGFGELRLERRRGRAAGYLGTLIDRAAHLIISLHAP